MPGRIGFVVGSVASLDCVCRSEGGRPEAYVATAHRLGLDLGITEQCRFTWAVNAPTGRFGCGELAGTHGGVGANASVGVGGGSKFLVGGPSNAYALQPISVHGQTGFNVAAGVADLELEPVQIALGHRVHHHIHHMRDDRGRKTQTFMFMKRSPRQRRASFLRPRFRDGSKGLREARPDDKPRTRPGISRFPDVRLHI